MPWEICYVTEQKLILAKNKGHFTIQDFRDEVYAIAQLSEEKQAFSILLDDTKMSSDVSTIDIFSFPSLYEEAGLSKRVKIAVVIPESSRGLADFNFFETVSVNRGYNTKIFFNMADAKAWLT